MKNNYLWAKEADGTIYKYGKGRGQHFWDTIFKDVGKAVNGMAVIDTLGWATLSVAEYINNNHLRSGPAQPVEIKKYHILSFFESMWYFIEYAYPNE